MRLRIRLARAVRAVANWLDPQPAADPLVPSWQITSPWTNTMPWPPTTGPLVGPSAMCQKCGTWFRGTHACIGPLTTAPVIRWVNT